MNLAMAAWVLAYLYMHSFHPVKADRYIITVLPALAYAISLSLNNLSALMRSRRASTVLSIAVTLLMVSSAIHYTAGMPQPEGYRVIYSRDGVPLPGRFSRYAGILPLRYRIQWMLR